MSLSNRFRFNTLKSKRTEIDTIELIPNNNGWKNNNIDLPNVFHGLKLDSFQLKAIEAVSKDYSVLVSAPTGIGKTLIADFTVERISHQNKQVIYTAPIKALSSQKYKDFRTLFGEEEVGIMTGDIVINKDAPVLVMTTEILRNIVFAEPERLENVSWVIFDEIHYLGDIDRGQVWEQCIILMPEHIKILGLSATIPNATELGNWIHEVRKTPIAVVKCSRRPVPLEHLIFEKDCGICTRDSFFSYWRKMRKKLKRKNWGYVSFPSTNFIDLVKALDPKQHMPCLYFVFSRRACEQYAKGAADILPSLSRKDARYVLNLLEERAQEYGLKASKDLEMLKKTLLKGIAFHHAGLLPVFKDVVEDLFKKRLVKILFATETFALGVNYPVKTVCFDAPTKFDGKSFRPMTVQEYYQMAGRAGRRGIDTKGNVITLMNLEFSNPSQFPNYAKKSIEPLTSTFSLSYNSCLNLVGNFPEIHVKEILSKNFATFLNHNEAKEIKKDINNYKKKLKHLEKLYCSAEGNLNCPKEYSQLKTRIRKKEETVTRGPKTTSPGSIRRWEKAKKGLYRLRKKAERTSVKNCSRQEEKQCYEWNEKYNEGKEYLKELQYAYEQLSPPDICFKEYNNKLDFLQSIGYVEDTELTPRGKTAKDIYVQELLVTELIFQGVFHDLNPDEINALVVAIDHEPRGSERDKNRSGNYFKNNKIYDTIYWLKKREEKRFGYSTVLFSEALSDLAYKWSKGADFIQISKKANLDEGDIVLGFRRGVDLLRQMLSAVDDKSLTDKLRVSMSRLSRDIVSVEL